MRMIDLADRGILPDYMIRMGIRRLDRMRLVEVRERIDRKMMEQLRPLAARCGDGFVAGRIHRTSNG